jgi:DNA-binding CsgD family transcriptional regulator
MSALIVERFSLADVLNGQPGSSRVIAGKVENEGSPSEHNFFDALLRIFSQCRDRFEQSGFVSFEYCAYEAVGRRITSAYMLGDFVPAPFMQSYFAQDLHECDSRFVHAQAADIPIAWSTDDIESVLGCTESEKGAALIDLLCAHGMRSGLTFSISVPLLNLCIGINMASEMAGTTWIDDRMIGAMLTSGFSVHQIALPFIEARIANARCVVLAEQELAVLRKLVLGLSDQEIAEAMNVSSKEIARFVHKLQDRFHVDNRAQLAYLAARRLPANL